MRSGNVLYFLALVGLLCLALLVRADEPSPRVKAALAVTPRVDPFQAPAKAACPCGPSRDCAYSGCQCDQCDELIRCCDGTYHRKSEWKGKPFEYPPTRAVKSFGQPWNTGVPAGGYSFGCRSGG